MYDISRWTPRVNRAKMLSRLRRNLSRLLLHRASESCIFKGMKIPSNIEPDYPVDPEAWHRGMERIRALSPWLQVLIDPVLVEEALHGETEFIS